MLKHVEYALLSQQLGDGAERELPVEKHLFVSHVHVTAHGKDLDLTKRRKKRVKENICASHQIPGECRYLFII